ncbi:hypothetical protein R3P38DRAFT_2589257, partial [Favolaschia claudopus]
SQIQASPSRLSFMESEALPYTSPDRHHYISSSRNFYFYISSWLNVNKDDPAVKVRFELQGTANEFTPGQRYRLKIKNERIYKHKIFRVNFTTYDVRVGRTA